LLFELLQIAYSRVMGLIETGTVAGDVDGCDWNARSGVNKEKRKRKVRYFLLGKDDINFYFLREDDPLSSLSVCLFPWVSSPI
jgi:hypothetical protein